MPSTSFVLDPRAGERLVDLALGDERPAFERRGTALDLRAIARRLVEKVLSVDSSRVWRMNHAQLIVCLAYLAFVATPFDSLQRPRGYHFPKSLLCFAAAWWEQEHLGILVTVRREDGLDVRVSPSWPLNAVELFPKEQVKVDNLGNALQQMLEKLVEAANRALGCDDRS